MKNSKQLALVNLQIVGILFALAACCLSPIDMQAQQEKKFIYQGNNQYKNKDFAGAEKEYSKALIKNKDSYKGSFNLGDAYYKQGKYEEATNQFQQLTHRATSKDSLAKAYHNLGNALLKSRKYQESIDAYKNALKNSPNDEDTRYNLSYAQQMIREQQQQQKKQDKDNKDKKNKDKKEQQKEKNKDKKDDQNKEKEEDQEDKDKNKDRKEEQKPEPNKISKEDAKRILDALQNDEKNIQNKVKKDKTKGVQVQIEKDW